MGRRISPGREGVVGSGGGSGGRITSRRHAVGVQGVDVPPRGEHPGPVPQQVAPHRGGDVVAPQASHEGLQLLRVLRQEVADAHRLLHPRSLRLPLPLPLPLPLHLPLPLPLPLPSCKVRLLQPPASLQDATPHSTPPERNSIIPGAHRSSGPRRNRDTRPAGQQAGVEPPALCRKGGLPALTSARPPGSHHCVHGGLREVPPEEGGEVLLGLRRGGGVPRQWSPSEKRRFSQHTLRRVPSKQHSK